jgi:uncharacterized membrane protein
MTSTVRHATLLRWTIVAIHTALVVSTGTLLAGIDGSRHARAARAAASAVVLLTDLPVGILMIPITQAVNAPGGIVTRPWVFLTAFGLLGGVQWYLLASLLARWTCGFQRTVPFASRRFGLAACLGLLLVAGCAVLPWSGRLHQVFHARSGGAYSPPPVAFQGHSKDLRQTVIVPTLDTPMPEHRNVVWCGTLQLAWNHLGKDVLHGPPQVRGAEEVAARLNRAQLGEGDLPADSYLATAGFAMDGITDKVKAEMRERFQEDVEIEPLDPGDILAYAYLQASAAFTIPFFDKREPLRFKTAEGQEAKVGAFGIEEKHEYAYRALREQVGILHWLRKNGDYEHLAEFVVDLCQESPTQIVVACVPLKATLAEMLDDVKEKTREFARKAGQAPFVDECPVEFGIRDVLLVPNLNWEVRHHFAELEGTDKRLLNEGFRSYYIARAIQSIRFRLDRSGAELASEAQVPCKPMATYYVCDRPFLIVAKKRGAERPFFVMWVDNAELLCKP